MTKDMKKITREQKALKNIVQRGDYYWVQFIDLDTMEIFKEVRLTDTAANGG